MNPPILSMPTIPVHFLYVNEAGILPRKGAASQSCSALRLQYSDWGVEGTTAAGGISRREEVVRVLIGGGRFGNAQREVRQPSGDGLPSLFRVVLFQLLKVSQQLVEFRDADEIPADHFVGAQGRLPAGPQADQHARDDRTIGLDFNAMPRAAQQVPTAQDLLQEAKEDLDGPAVMIEQSDDLGWHVQQVGGNAEGAIATRGRRDGSLLMRLGLDGDQPHAMLWFVRSGFGAQADDLVTGDTFGQGCRRERPSFQNVVDADVANAADVTALGLADAVEEGEFGEATVHDVETVGFDGALQHGPFVTVAAAIGSDVDTSRHIAIDFEVGV